MSSVRFRGPIALLIAPALVAVCLTQVTTTSATAAPAAAASRAKGEPVAVNIRIATFNSAAMQSTRKAVSDIKKIAAEAPDVIALQEMGSPARRKAVREKLASCENCLYDAFMPQPAVPGSTPLLYRSDRFTLLDSGTRQVTEATNVGPRGAGPSTIRAKFVNWVRLRDIATGRQIYVLNNHAVPTVQTSKGGPNNRLRKRVTIYRKHMAGLTALINEIKTTTGGAVFVTGDLNVNYRKDRVVKADMFPFYTLGQVGVHANYEALGEPEDGTHVLRNGYSKRLIDYVYYLNRRMVSPQSQQIMKGLNSDHRAVLVDFKLMNRGCFKRGEALC